MSCRTRLALRMFGHQEGCYGHSRALLQNLLGERAMLDKAFGERIRSYQDPSWALRGT